MHYITLSRLRQARWPLVLAAILSSLGAALPLIAFTASGQTNTSARSSTNAAGNSLAALSIFELPETPKPASASRNQLPKPFTKPVPATVSDLKAMQTYVERLVARVSPAVVAVEIGAGSGSGVLISPDGYVLTAGHVCVAPNRDVRFTFPDGKTANGKTIGLSQSSDLGLMKIEGSGPWPYAAMGDLKGAFPGDWVLALGHPGGFDATRSLVVRLGRLIQFDSDTLQSDCPISPGDSGGPLFDMFGRVIGIHSYISSSATANFHVTTTACYEHWDQFIAQLIRQLPRSYSGLTESDNAGCRVVAVERNSPAAKAGIQVGDIVLKVDGREVRVAATFRRWEREAKPGETLALEIKRGEQTLPMKLVLVSPPRQRR
jgi:serine protease Do